VQERAAFAATDWTVQKKDVAEKGPLVVKKSPKIAGSGKSFRNFSILTAN
jgi:hypothetical protein